MNCPHCAASPTRKRTKKTKLGYTTFFSRLSEKRNREAAQHFFKQAVAVVGYVSDQVTTDGHRSYPRAIRETRGSHVQHRMKKYLKNLLEQDHRGIKQRDDPMRGFGNVTSAARECSCI
jgi:transposase-like protein